MVSFRTLRAVALVLILSSSAFARARVSGYCTQGGQVSVTNTIPSSTKIMQSYPQCAIQVFYNNGATGVVSTSGTAVTLNSGTPFNANSGWPGLPMTIAGTSYTILSVNSNTSITLTSSAGSQGFVSYSMPPQSPAAIYSDNSGTVLSNPFTASQTGYWGFYADNGTYDIVASGGGIPAPITWSAVSVVDPTTLVTVADVLAATGGLDVMAIVAGAVTPNVATAWVHQVNLTGAVDVNPPVNFGAGDTLLIQIIQPSTGAGYGVTFDSFYTGISQFALDQTPGTYASLVFQVQADAASAMLIQQPMNGNPIL